MSQKPIQSFSRICAKHRIKANNLSDINQKRQTKTVRQCFIVLDTRQKGAARLPFTFMTNKGAIGSKLPYDKND